MSAYTVGDRHAYHAERTAEATYDHRWTSTEGIDVEQRCIGEYAIIARCNSRQNQGQVI